ncbi:MAG: sensor histidine kinase [Ekhidna sp.]|nr:sensor histidine kinase [Ekhidna sp.]
MNLLCLGIRNRIALMVFGFSLAQFSNSLYAQNFSDAEMDSVLSLAERYFDEGNYPKSFDVYQALLDASIQIGDSSQMGFYYFQMGRMEFYQGTRTSREQALGYFEQALNIGQITSDTSILIRAHRGFGGTLIYDQSLFDSSIYHLKIAEILAIKSGDYRNASGAQSVIGSYLLSRDLLNEAGTYFDKSMVYAVQSGEKESMAYAVQRQGIFQMYKGNYDLSEQLLKEALTRYKEIGNKNMLMNMAEHLRFLYERMKSWDGYLEQTKILDSLRSEIYSEQNARDLQVIRERYESEIKEREIVQQALDIKIKESTITKQKNAIVLISASALIALLVGFLFYSYNRVKQNQKLQAAILIEKERGFKSVITAAESERKRISKDLHDGIGQQLNALRLSLISLSNQFEDNSKNEFNRLIELSSQTAEEVRTISHQMMPKALLEKGLVEAVEDLLQSCFEHSQITYSFEYDNMETRFEEKIEISLYRILQELLSNIIRHAEAFLVSVQLIQNHQKLILFVEDNGKGIFQGSDEGHGLLNIKSRLDMISGRVNYEPSPDAGTIATIIIPIS